MITLTNNSQQIHGIKLNIGKCTSQYKDARSLNSLCHFHWHCYKTLQSIHALSCASSKFDALRKFGEHVYEKKPRLRFMRNSYSSFVTVVNTDQIGNNYTKSQGQVKGSLWANVTFQLQSEQCKQIKVQPTFDQRK